MSVARGAADDSPAFLRFEVAGPIATIMLDNQRHRNAITAQMWQQFPPVLEELNQDPTVKVVVVRGAGNDFSAGAAIGELKEILRDPASGRHDGGYTSIAETALANFRKPTVAAIDGYCVGGAWQIAGACDIRIASDRARFGITPAKIGVIYPVSAIERLVQLVGQATAKYLLFSGDLVPATTARQMGLVSQVVPHPGFWAAISEFATRLSRRSQLSIQATKNIIDTIASGDRARLIERSNAWQRELAASGETEIGIRAFLAHETPEFAWGPAAS